MLPFRDDPDPWRILVSEFMLQQTRVEAMRDRYQSFLERFPDAASLAGVNEDDAVAAWSGLGYYRRARFLHRTARRIDASGGFPREAKGLRELPGVGEYTAAAVASIAFAEPVPVVDGNVSRVLSRCFLIPGHGAGFHSRVRTVAGRLMDAGGSSDPGRWNQALMELGALVCTPKSPRCRECPVRDACRAFRKGETGRFPERPAPPAPTRVRLVQAVIRDDRGRLLLFRRKEAPLAGLYELPGGECTGKETPEAALHRAAAGYGMRIGALRALPGFRHAIMNRRFEVRPFQASLAGPAPGAGRWVAAGDLAEIPCGSMLTKTLAGGGYTPAPVKPV